MGQRSNIVMKEILDRVVREFGLPRVLSFLVEQCARMGAKERQLSKDLQDALNRYQGR